MIDPRIRQCRLWRHTIATAALVVGFLASVLMSLGWAAMPDITYRNPTFGFQLVHPGNFVVKTESADRLRQYDPVPIAGIAFMNPIMAQGALAMAEPPDLAVRVYAAGAADSLAGWLTATGLLQAGSAVRARPVAGGEGLEVCAETLIAPGCAVYVLADRRVYQLTPASRDGEAMLASFAVVAPR